MKLFGKSMDGLRRGANKYKQKNSKQERSGNSCTNKARCNCVEETDIIVLCKFMFADAPAVSCATSAAARKNAARRETSKANKTMCTPECQWNTLYPC